jgi:hypothetical protein
MKSTAIGPLAVAAAAAPIRPPAAAFNETVAKLPSSASDKFGLSSILHY